MKNRVAVENANCMRTVMKIDRMWKCELHANCHENRQAVENANCMRTVMKIDRMWKCELS